MVGNGALATTDCSRQNQNKYWKKEVGEGRSLLKFKLIRRKIIVKLLQEQDDAHQSVRTEPHQTKD